MPPPRRLFLLLLAVCVLATPPSTPAPGRKHRKILGGFRADISEFPYLANFRPTFGNGAKTYTTSCGATILDERNLLTAAHCVISQYPGYKLVRGRVRVGSTYASTGGQAVPINKVVIHANFSIHTMKNDIAVLHTKVPILFFGEVLPVVIGSRTPPKGTLLTIVGWGARLSGRATVDHLYAAHIPKQSFRQCRDMYKAVKIKVYNTSLCAGFKSGAHDACQGDSGGPILLNHEQVGITSWGDGCGKAGRFGVYTDVSKFHHFIANSMV